MKRLYNLDYLRGLAACSIMVYHIYSWVFGEPSAITFLGRMGLYGVSIFYILSGLTLFLVYFKTMEPSKLDIVPFVKKRIYRIFPLLWLVTILTLVISKIIPDPTKLFLNLSGLFGFLNWDKYYSTGVWSIGNELVFYVFFPFFILFTKKFKPLMIILSLLILGIYLYFTFSILNSQRELALQWRNYINPLNQVLLFLGGFLSGYFLINISIKNSILLIMLFIGFGTFLMYPTNTENIDLVTGVNRIVFTVCCFLICIFFYKLNYKLPNIIHLPLILLGEASYSVYLLHPIVFNIVDILEYKFGRHFYPLSRWGKVTVTIVLTLLFSYLVFRYFEKFFMQLGKKVKSKKD